MTLRNNEMYIVVVTIFWQFTAVTADECTNYTDLPNLNRRSPSITYDPATPAISDNIGFREGWYRANNADMSTTRPPMNRCGTVYPFYLKNEIPVDTNVLQTRACLGDDDGDCYYYKNIRVKNCGAYRVYYLVPLGFNSAAYCFSYDQTNEVPTENFTTADAEYQSIIWQSENGKEIPRILFNCNFSPLYNISVLYAVTWKVDNNIEIGETKVVNLTELEEAYLNEKEITDAGYRHGINLFCEVGARYKRNGVTGPVQTGTGFFAGVKISNQFTTLKAMNTANITFELTVPFACGSKDTCELSIQMLNPCETSDCNRDLVSNNRNCNSSFEGKKSMEYYKGNNWRKQAFIEVKQTETNKISNIKHPMIIGLITNEVEHLFWSNSRLPDITVNIDYNDDAWKGQLCYANADPHLKTFDNMHFEQHFAGEFIFYRNGKQEVQYKTQHCYSTRTGPSDIPFCVCGIAARAGRDVFVIDTCNNAEIVNFRLCEDSTLTVTSDGDSHYKVLFPTGTELILTLNKYYPYMNVKLFPSASDRNNTEGLCGNLDGNCTNDFKKRGETVPAINNHCGYWPYKYPENFTRSWQLNDSETLFKPNGSRLDSLESWNTDALFCSCPRANRSTSPIPVNLADCSYNEYTVCSNYNRMRPFLCTVKKSKRKRRDVRNQLIVKSENDNLLHDQRHRRSITDMMSVEEATFHCETVFNESVASKNCMENVKEIDDSYLQMCIADLQLTGNASLAEESLEILKDDCVTWTRKNLTFVSHFPDVASVIYTSTCPKNCSNQGSCINGECYCEDGYTGTDCSQDITTPPIITAITDNGLCDTSEEQCQDIYIYGNNFFSTNLTKCKFETQLTMVDNSEIHKGDVAADGTQISTFEAVCDPPQETDSSIFYVTYNISVSNDGVSYSNTIPLYIFDSTCQKVTYDTGDISISLKESFCFIDRVCVPEGTTNTQSRCLMCDSSKNKFDWSNKTGCDISSTSTESSSPLHKTTTGSKKSDDDENDSVNVVIIVTSLAAVMIISLVTIIVVKIKMKSGKLRVQTPQAKGEDHYPNVILKEVTKTSFLNNATPMMYELSQTSNSRQNRPQSAQTISSNFTEDQSTSMGPDLSELID